MSAKDSLDETMEKSGLPSVVDEGKAAVSRIEKGSLSNEEEALAKKYFNKMRNKPVKYQRGQGEGGTFALSLRADSIREEMLAPFKQMEAFGTVDSELQDFLLKQVVETFPAYGCSDDADHEGQVAAVNNAFALLAGINPKDELEGMLGIQLVAAHNVAMECLKLAMLEDQTLQGKEVNLNQGAKMLRVFGNLLDGLKRYRTGGQQKMIVEHVNVAPGGQAVVGIVNQGVGLEKEK